jgi:hypothetical protein
MVFMECRLSPRGGSLPEMQRWAYRGKLLVEEFTMAAATWGGAAA